MKKTASFALVLLTVAATALAHGINPPVQGSGGKKNANTDATQVPLTGLAPRPGTELPDVRELTYVVEPIVQEESCRLRVSLIFRGDSSGNTRLLLPLEWSDGVALYRAIRNIQSLSEDTKIEDTNEPHVKTVHHRPNQRVTLTYEVVSQPPGTKLTREIYHYPVLRPSYFYVMGQALWVYPDMPESTPLQLSLHWKNIPDGWALINSYGISQPKQIVKTTLESFRKGTFLAGDYRIKRIIINQEPVYAVTRGSFGLLTRSFTNSSNRYFKSSEISGQHGGFLITMWRCYRQMIRRNAPAVKAGPTASLSFCLRI